MAIEKQSQCTQSSPRHHLENRTQTRPFLSPCHALLVVLFAVPAMVLTVEPGSAEKATLRVLSYNIKHGYGMDGKVDLSRSAELIKRLDPDLVALQEIDKSTERTKRVDQTAELGRMTNMHATFGRFFDYQGGEYGMAVLSRKKPLEVNRRNGWGVTGVSTGLLSHPL